MRVTEISTKYVATDNHVKFTLCRNICRKLFGDKKSMQISAVIDKVIAAMQQELTPHNGTPMRSPLF